MAKKIAVFAGHGGSDHGARANGHEEKVFTLAISNAVTAILREWGYVVINNHVTDTERSITHDAKLANDNNVDAVVEIHLNSNDGTPETGSEAFVSIRDATMWNGRAKKLADAILARLASLGLQNHGVFTNVNPKGLDGFGILRLTHMPTVLLEVAYLNNPQDMAKLDIDKVAYAIAEGIQETVV
ncbi:MAG: N-acetylmuramoyl-L-alanine amidase [Defluviitaleaceae bacterium]|nr:N-acetylmuramoyl-L-alanine amidase [Defluviitaleaceae bacterium]